MRVFCSAAAILGALVQPSVAQERPRPVAELAAGALLFADDGVVEEGFLGGTVRVYVTPRISLGPEIAYVRGDNHSHLMLTGNMTFDVVRERPAIPFVVVGGGLFQTREQFPTGPFTSGEGAFTAGGGIRGALGDRITVGAEARVGWELHIRLNGLIGVRLGR